MSGDTTRVIPAVIEEFQLEDLGDEDVAAVEALPKGSALLIILKAGHSDGRFLLDADLATAGRHPRTDVFLDDVTVSRHHARFTREGEQFLVQDENSLNGTYVNGELIDAPTALRRGDEVQIGKFRMVFFVNQD
jgi:pSer/pThr/pTyr-binding forkhead associated (FHA) protein